MEVQPDFRDLLRLFRSRGVEYVIVGAYALAHHGVPRNTGDIDLLTSISGVTWEEARAGKADGHYGDVPVSFLGRAQLTANKRAAGRTKDLADLEALGERPSP